MNESLKEEYANRAVMLENLDNIMAHARRKDTSQLSLFQEETHQTIQLKQPDNINFQSIAKMEKDVLGVCLSYNEFDKYILHSLLFCNNTINDVHQIIENNNNIIFMGIVEEIDYRKSQYGNFYAKVSVRDFAASIDLFLFGGLYKKHISQIFKGRCYLIKCTYDSATQRTNIVSLKCVDDLNINDYISGIVLDIQSNLKDVIFVKEYANTRMFGDELDLFFKFQNQTFKHPVRVKFTEEIYLDIKNHINSIEIIKKQKH
jgi:DNA polymerase III alpha subunit